MICSPVTARALKVLIAEDEPLAARRLSYLLEKIEGVVVVGTCPDGTTTIDRIRSDPPDLLLLDIHMPGADGFEVIEALEDTRSMAVVFTTAFDRYAVQALRADAVDYLLKPVDPELLKIAIGRARSRLRERSAAGEARSLRQQVDRLTADLHAEMAKPCDAFWIKSSGRTYRLAPDAVEWIEAVRDYACLHSEGRTFLVRETMTSLERRLDRARFVRVHRSAIVNIAKVSHVRTTETGAQVLVLEPGTDIRVGRKYQRRLTALLKPPAE